MRSLRFPRRLRPLRGAPSSTEAARKPGAASGLASAAMTNLVDAEARRRIREEFSATLFVEAQRDRQNHRSRRSDRRLDIRWGGNAQSNRRGHLHRKSSRRNEASSAKRGRKSEVESDARGTRSARPSARGAGARSYRHDPRLLRRSPPRAADRGGNRSAIRSRHEGGS